MVGRRACADAVRSTELRQLAAVVREGELMPVEVQPTFEAIEVFWLKQHRLYQIHKLQDALIFTYVGVPEGFRKPAAHLAVYGLLGLLMYQRSKQAMQRLNREATEMKARIAAAAADDLLPLHRFNFRVNMSDITDSRFVASVFHVGYGTFWRFRENRNGVRTFRFLGSPGAIHEVKRILSATGAAAS
jgi:hypothetical protein